MNWKNVSISLVVLLSLGFGVEIVSASFSEMIYRVILVGDAMDVTNNNYISIWDGSLSIGVKNITNCSVDGQIWKFNGTEMICSTDLTASNGSDSWFSNVGIGTDNTTEKLRVSGGDIVIDNGESYKALDVGGTPRNLIACDSNDDILVGSQYHDKLFLFDDTGKVVTLDGTGKVGIGTIAPDKTFHVNSSTVNNVALFESSDATAVINFKDNNTTAANTVGLGAVGDDLKFIVGAATTMTILSDGKVGIGNAVPGQRLDVGTIASTETWIRIQRGGTDDSVIEFYRSQGTVVDGKIYMSSDENIVIENIIGGDLLYSGGNVGIGENDPNSVLTVVDTSQVTTPLVNLTITGSSIAGRGALMHMSTRRGDGSDDVDLFRIRAGTSGITPYFTLRNTGSVGIGTESPTSPDTGIVLHVSESSTDVAQIVLGTTDTVVIDNQLIGGLGFINNDATGDNPHYSGIKSRASGTSGAMDLEFYAGTINYENNNETSMIILEDGNVGIGTETPQVEFVVSKLNGVPSFELIRDDATIGSNNNIGILNFAGDEGSDRYISARIYSQTGQSWTATGKSSRLIFDVTPDDTENLTEAMRITENGKIGINITSPTEILHIGGNIEIEGCINYNCTQAGGCVTLGTCL